MFTDAAKGWRGDLAAIGDPAGARGVGIVHNDGDHDLGAAGRKESDEGRDMVFARGHELDFPTGHQLGQIFLGRAGLARDFVAGDRRFGRGPAHHRTMRKHLCHRARGTLRNHAAYFLSLKAVERHTRRIADITKDLRLEQHPAARDDPHRLVHLQDRHGDAMAHRHARDGQIIPPFRRAQDTRRFVAAGKSGLLAKAERAHVVVKALLPELHPELGGAAIAGTRNNFSDRQRVIEGVVLAGQTAQLIPIFDLRHRAVEEAVRRHEPLIERRRRCDNLKHGTGFINVRHRDVLQAR